jgi:hypothetical protein
VKDRPTSSHEYVFLLSKSDRYFYDADAIREPHVDKRLSKSGARAMRGQAAMKPTGKEDSVDRWYHPLGHNARSVWSIATQPSQVEHFAVWPEELARRCILAGTSAKGACATCGAPYAREMEKVKCLDGEPVESLPPLKNTDRAAPSSATGYAHNRISLVGRDLGWVPTCEHEGAGVEPCVVLDPFLGSGTTALVATRLGRRAAGIELSRAYAEEARGRLSSDAPLLDLAEATA